MKRAKPSAALEGLRESVDLARQAVVDAINEDDGNLNSKKIMKAAANFRLACVQLAKVESLFTR